MRGLWRDLLYGVRMIRANPGFTAVAVFSLALGIGANSTIFSLLDGMFMRPLPVREPDRLVRIFTSFEKYTQGDVSFPDYLDFRERAPSIEDAVAWRNTGLILNDGGNAELILGQAATGNYFSMLGLKPAAGRLFGPAEDQPGAIPVAVMSHAFWQRRFGGSPEAIGKTVRLNDHGVTLIGVAPKGFKGAEAFLAVDLWVPVRAWNGLGPRNAAIDRRDARNFRLFGRLRPGAAPERARAEIAAISRQLAQTYPETNKDRVSTAISEAAQRKDKLGLVLMLMLLVGLVLLLACANVAGLLAARAESRRREIAIRLALGAGRARLIRQLLTESVLLAALGVAGGLALARWLIGLVPSLLPPAGPFALGFDFRIDQRVLLFTLAVSLATAFIFGLAPAIRASRPDLAPAIKGEAPRSRRRRFSFRGALVAGQVAVSVILLIGAGLVLRSLIKTQEIDTGFECKNLLIAMLVPEMNGYKGEQAREFYRVLAERMRAVPGVKGASLATRVPLSANGGGIATAVVIPGRPAEEKLSIKCNSVDAGFLALMGTRILRGRDFDERDGPQAAKVALINETMARRFWSGDEPIGRSFRTGPNGPEWRIVGVVQDGKYNKIKEAPEPYVYFPFAQKGGGDTSFVIETAGDPRAVVEPFRAAVRALDPNVPVLAITTLRDTLNFALFFERMISGLLGAFGAMGLTLASIGLYAVIAYSVNRRTHEIGVRMAMGARQRDVLVQVIRHGLTLALAGIAIGAPAAVALARIIESVLYGVSPADPPTLACVAALVLLVAVAASFIPARRAAAVDPIVALRCE